MDIFSKLRRTIVKEGLVYKSTDLFTLNEEYREDGSIDRSFLKEKEIPLYYKLLGGDKKWDIKELCVKELKEMSGKYEPIDNESKPKSLKTLNPRDIKENDPTLNTYCRLYNTYQYANNRDKFINDLSIVFWFVRPNEKDNRVKFHYLMDLINDSDDPEGTMSILAYEMTKKINDQDGDRSADIKKNISRLKGKERVSKEKLIDILTKTKYNAYKEYESSFVGENFSEYSKVYNLKYKESLEYGGFKNLLKNLYTKFYKSDKSEKDKFLTEYSYSLISAIKKLYDPKSVSKADLQANKNILDINGNLVIPKGGLVEVKMRDYTKQSYLSEYFSIYKESKIDPEFKKKRMVNLYNIFIEKTFDLFNESYIGSDIIKQIRKNTYGILFAEENYNGTNMPIYVPLKNIDIWWSSEGWGNKNQKRLTLRYHVKNKKEFYYYDRLNGVMIPNGINESYDLYETSKLLLEGRKEDARAKYPDVPESDFNYYVENDPSGNQKYLDWLLKYYWQVSPDILVEYIKFFHQYQNMFIEKDISRHTPTSLDREMVDVQEKLLQKQEKKQAKKQSIKLYEDDRWLVVSPKSWKASCYYGAGTKWCITMKENPSYWNRYIKNSTFFFIIDKKKKQDDPIYKVAYRKIGRRGKYELWNAPDYEFSNSTIGQEYMEELPKEIKERINSLHLQNFPPTDGRAEWIDDDPRAQAIVNGLDTEIIENVDDYWYGMPVYEVDDSEHYVVGEGGEMDAALRENYNDYSDTELIEYYDYDGYYLTMTDQDGYISSEVSDYLSDLSDREKIELADLLDKESDIKSEIEELENQLESEEDDQITTVIKNRLELLRENLNDLVSDADDIISDLYREGWERCLYNGPKECFVDEKGWFKDAVELYRSGLVDLDRYSLIEGIVQNQSDYDAICPYGWDNFTDDDGGDWYVFKVDY